MDEKNRVKTGREILDDFFQNIKSIDGVDVCIVNVLSDLYKNGNFTEKNLLDRIKEIRKANANAN
jgi:hypothetical protein